MSRVVKSSDVMTLAEAAKYLRTSRQAVKDLAENGTLPAQRVNGAWRFLKEAINEWLRGRTALSSRDEMLRQAGAFKDDPDLPKILADIYAARGRPEVDAH